MRERDHAYTAGLHVATVAVIYPVVAEDMRCRLSAIFFRGVHDPVSVPFAVFGDSEPDVLRILCQHAPRMRWTSHPTASSVGWIPLVLPQILAAIAGVIAVGAQSLLLRAAICAPVVELVVMERQFIGVALRGTKEPHATSHRVPAMLFACAIYCIQKSLLHLGRMVPGTIHVSQVDWSEASDPSMSTSIGPRH